MEVGEVINCQYFHYGNIYFKKFEVLDITIVRTVPQLIELEKRTLTTKRINSNSNLNMLLSPSSRRKVNLQINSSSIYIIFINFSK